MRFSRLLFAAGLTAALFPTFEAAAQLQVAVANGEVRLQSATLGRVIMTRAASKATGATWTVTDAQGFTYTVGYDGDGDGGGGGGTSGGGTSGGGSGGPIIIGGYDAALTLLRTVYGATVRHDSVLGVDHIDFPGQADPIGYFFEIATRDSVMGFPLYHHLRLIDVPSSGTFSPVSSDLAKTNAPRLFFPNDALFRLQWALSASRLLLAQWHPVAAQKAIRVGVIDSGVGTAQRSHPGLDGAAMGYTAVAPTTGSPVPHGLTIATLLGDRSQDGSGVVGLLGAWGNNACFPQPPLLAQAQPSISVYNVGDFGPDTYSVARALYAAADAGVDVVNLSLHVAPSPLIEEAVAAVQEAGVIVVASAGNYAADAAAKDARFPASLPGVISVGSVDASLRPSATSATNGVDLYAPGVDIVVGGTNGTWAYASGTSYAAPHVVAAIALMRAANPAVTADQALAALQQYAIRRGARGVPVLNALSSLNAVIPRGARVRFPSVSAGCGLGGLFFGKDDEPISTVAYDDRIDDELFPETTPETTAIRGVYPNPSRGRATLALDLAERQNVRVTMHDLLGREVARLADGVLDAGTQRLDVDGTTLPAGVYVVRVVTERGTFSRSLTLVR